MVSCPAVVCLALCVIGLVAIPAAAAVPSTHGVAQLVSQLEALAAKEDLSPTDIQAALQSATHLKEQLATEAAHRNSLLPVLGSIMELTYNTVVASGLTAWEVATPVREAAVSGVTWVWEKDVEMWGKAQALYAEHVEEKAAPYIAQASVQIDAAVAVLKKTYATANVKALNLMYPEAEDQTQMRVVAVEAAVLTVVTLLTATVVSVLWYLIVGPILRLVCCCGGRKKSRVAQLAKRRVQQAAAARSEEEVKRARADKKRRRRKAQAAKKRAKGAGSDDDEPDQRGMEQFAGGSGKHKGRR